LEKDGTSFMPEQQQQIASSHEDGLPWWMRLCRWLWKLTGFLGTSVVLALVVNVASTWLTASKGALPADAPLRLLMTYWPISLTVGCCLLLLATLCWAISRWNVPSGTVPVAIDTQDRERMIRRLRLRYEQMLSQSLQGVVQLELGLASRPVAIHNEALLSLRLPEQAEQALPPHTSIVDAYEQAQQELLVLGEPGAGKSTLLLELAHRLVEQAEQETKQPLPVLVPLSSWATDRRPLHEWLIEQLAWLYEVPQKLSQQWVQAGLVLPLLDGLDEMVASARPACIEAINTYHREHLGPLVVSSRTQEYENAARKERLALHTAVVVQPLSFVQVDAHLATLGKPLAGLRSALKQQPLLREIATTPLMLQVLMLTYHGISVRALSQKAAHLQEQIWMDYVQRMVARKGDAQRYPLHGTTARLSWLASQMRQRNQSIFFLEYLQPDWLPRRQRILYQWSVWLFFGLVMGLEFGLIYGLVLGLVVGLIFGLVLGLVVGLGIELASKIDSTKMRTWSWKKFMSGPLFRLEPRIYPAEALTWSWTRFISRSILGLIVGLIVELIVELRNDLFFVPVSWLVSWSAVRLIVERLFFEPVSRLISWSAVGLIIGLIVGLVSGVSRERLPRRFILSPNEGIRRSFRHGLLLFAVGSGFGLILGLIVELSNMLSNGLIFDLFSVLSCALLFGLTFGLIFGLGATFQHYTLRFWLARLGVFPWKAVPFLEDATTRILLRRVGGGYRFTHRLLLDYFANLETASPSTSKDVHTVQQTSPP
jgi:DNA polymerase III delta prime subunit